MKRPKLRDSNSASRSSEPYQLNAIPHAVIKRMAAYFIYLIATGRSDISGNDWGDAFAYAINGQHLSSPLGIADVVLQNMAWSLKTIRCCNPYDVNSLRIISGRCSPDFSYGIRDPHKDVQATGNAIISIWNERINIAQEQYTPLRSCILLRNYTLDIFLIFEREIHHYPPNEYVWEENKNGNLVAKRLLDGITAFTWQPHGAQFTIQTPIPPSVIKFSLQKPRIINIEQVLDAVAYSDQWVRILDK